MKRTVAVLSALCLLPNLFSCEKKAEYPKTEFFAMNTYGVITADGADKELLQRLQENVLHIEKQLSRTYEESEICRLSSGVKPSAETAELLKKLSEISYNTQGAFDFTLGTLCELWDVNGENPHVPHDEDIEEALSHCGYEKVRIGEEDGVYYCDDAQLKPDLGAAAKGYAGQKQIDTLKREGIQNAAVNLGGNVSVIGSSPENKKNGVTGWNVGVNNPFDTSDLLGTLVLCDKTVSVSGSYERYFEENGVRYHHILDSVNGYPAESGLLLAAVICSDGLYADALSTALFVLGLDGGTALYERGIYDFEAIFCLEDGTVYYTEGLDGIFTPNRDAKNIRNFEIISKKSE